MIYFTFFKDKSSNLNGFKAKNHGDGIVCAAVSILTQNTVNSIEMFTDINFNIDYNPAGGFMEFRITDDMQNNIDPAANILLKSLELGITGIKEEYSSEIEVNVIEVM